MVSKYIKRYVYAQYRAKYSIEIHFQFLCLISVTMFWAIASLNILFTTVALHYSDVTREETRPNVILYFLRYPYI